MANKDTHLIFNLFWIEKDLITNKIVEIKETIEKQIKTNSIILEPSSLSITPGVNNKIDKSIVSIQFSKL
ncbi:MAG: hypothetical protein ACRC1F_00260 [Metamycoplasmataceae bacterium]